MDSRQMTEVLSPRQIEVLQCMERGMTNRQIGKVMFASEKTVKAVCTTVFRRMGVHSRAAAVAMAYRRGWFACGLEHVVTGVSHYEPVAQTGEDNTQPHSTRTE